MGQMVRFPEAHVEQIAMTPGLGRHTEPGFVTGKSTNMINALIRLLQNQRLTPESEYYVDVNDLTAAGELIVSVMDRVGKSVSTPDIFHYYIEKYL